MREANYDWESIVIITDNELTLLIITSIRETKKMW